MKEKIVLELLSLLLKEDNNYKNIVIPKKYNEQRSLLKTLINVRPPKKINSEILNLEDKLLKLELQEKILTDVESLEEIEPNIILWLGDITTINADVIVNAGNNDGLGCFNPHHKCIDNVIHSNAGMRLRLECFNKLKGNKLKNGSILVCDAYNLLCKKVITTVGPQVINEVSRQDEIDLANCYKNSLEYAIKNNYKSIAFPSISTGLFGYPINEAKYIAYNSIKEILSIYNTNIKVIIDVFSKEDYDEYLKVFKS